MAELDTADDEVHVVTSPGPEVPDLRARADEVHLIRTERGISAWQDMKSMRAWVSLLRRIRPTLIIGGTPKEAASRRTEAWHKSWHSASRTKPTLRSSQIASGAAARERVLRDFSHVISHEPS